MKIESVEKTAKVIAALLKEKFPDVHFDVEAEYPNGEDQVVVRYTDGPLRSLYITTSTNFRPCTLWMETWFF